MKTNLKEYIKSVLEADRKKQRTQTNFYVYCGKTKDNKLLPGKF